MQRILAIVGVLAFLPLACGDGAWDLKATGRPIVYGSPDTNPAHMATVALTQGPNGGFFCSGTLITETVVLTAGHCLQGSSGNPYVFFGNDVRQAGEYRASVEGEVNPDYSGQSIRNDIALLRLASPAPADITPIPYLPAELGLSQADEGVTTVDFSGFGRDENDRSGVKLHVVDTIDVVCDGPGSCAGYVNPKMFGYDQQPGGPCSGDSGGPSYILRDGVEYVAGVTSYGDQDCAQYGASTTADRFAGWIDAFIAPEICGNGIDDDGDGLVDCADRECGGDTTCPDTCETAQAVRCSDVVHSTTDGGSWAFSQYSCLRDGVENGPEVAFRVDAPAGTRVTADLVPGAGGDLDFFLLPATGSSCDPQACLDGSFDYNTSEQIVFVVPAGGVYLVVETWDKPTSFDLRIICGESEVCANGVDDDYDGRVDCADPDCSEDPACLTPVEDCTNGIDDDEDGAADCDDEDCAAEPACQIPDEDCQNGLDDDQDGDADCDDADCADFPACVPPPPENCNNGLDDDQDGALDCDDSDCILEDFCQDDSGGGGGGCAATSAAGPGNLAFLLLGLLLSLRFRRR
jgi:MYXO-CTERM domain-containing protein